MRLVLTVAAATVLASPAAAQDFLGAIARQVATSAAERLVNRAADSAVAAVTGAGGGEQAGAPAPASGGGARPEVRVHGRVQPYDDDGDLLFQSENSNTVDFRGQPYWRTAVFCAGLSRTHDIQLAKSRAEWAASGRVYDEGDPEEYRTSQRNEEARWRRFALMRLDRDRPGSDHGAMVDAEIDRAEQELRTRDWTPRMAWRDLSSQCGSFYVINGNFIMMMANGRSR